MTKKIGIIGAMVEEIQFLHQHVTLTSQHTQSGITYYEGLLHNKQVIYCQSGVGKVNAAVCTQLLLLAGADCVIFTGVAGAIDPSLNIGDIVISSRCMQHDMDCTPLGFARGEIPFHPNYEFLADERLMKLAEVACNQTFPEGQCLIGKVLSGDQFIASREAVAEMYETLHGACAEMEGAAVAQVCDMNNIPFVIIRSMSDKADGSAHVNFAEFTNLAAERSYRIVNEMVKHV